MSEVRVDPDYRAFKAEDRSKPDRTPTTWTELIEYFPIGIDPAYWVRVERTKPASWGMLPVKGFLGEIRERLSEPELNEKLGGQHYRLQVFGPDPRHHRGPDGNVRTKPLTEVIEYDVPQLDPNPDSLPYGEDKPNMLRPRAVSPFGQSVTSADAEMHRTSVGVLERQLQREQQRNEEFTRRQEMTGGLGGVQPVVEFLGQQSQETLRMLHSDAARREDQHRRELEKAEEERRRLEAKIDSQKDRPTSEAAMFEGAAKLAAVFKPNGESTNQLQVLKDELSNLRLSQKDEIGRIETRYNQQIDSMKSSHQAEVERLKSSHQTEVERLKSSHKDESERRDRLEKDEASRIKDERDRERRKFDEDVKEVRNRAAEDLRAAREQSDKREKDLRDEYARREQQLKDNHDQRVKDEARNHEREMRSLKESWEGRMHTEGSTQKMQVTMAENEARRAREEADRARAEAEKNRDLPAQMEKFASAAEAMGWSREGMGAEGPKSWQEALGQAALTLAQNAPEVARSIGDTARAFKQGAPGQMGPGAPQPMGLPQGRGGPQRGGQPRAIRAPGGRTMQVRPLPLAVEDGPEVDAAYRPPPGPTYRRAPVAQPAQQPYQQQAYPPPPVPPQQYQQPYQAPPPAGYDQVYPQQPPQPPQQAPQQAPAPQQQQTAPPEQGAQAAQQASGAPFSPDDMEMFRKRMEISIVSALPAEDFAKQFVEMFPVESKRMVEWIQPDTLFSALSQHPSTASSPIVQRNGQQWTRKMWAEIGRLHQQAAA